MQNSQHFVLIRAFIDLLSYSSVL